MMILRISLMSLELACAGEAGAAAARHTPTISAANTIFPFLMQDLLAL